MTAAPNLTATSRQAGKQRIHELRLDGEVIATRRSETRRYTHVVAAWQPRVSAWFAVSWHMSSWSAQIKCNAMKNPHNRAYTAWLSQHRVIEITEAES